ncbi:3365_t:CDS:2, partial [Funneliformis geosporum]
RSTMAFGLFGEYISDSEDENYPTWPCLNKKNDGPINSQTDFRIMYKKNWLENRKKSE